MKAIKTKKFSEPIISYEKVKNSSILIVDKSTSVRYLDQQTLETLSGFKAKIEHDWYKNKVVEFSKNGAFFGVITQDVRESRLYDARTKKLCLKNERHHGEVTCVAIDPQGNYFFSGGEDGRTFVSDTKNFRLIFTLPHHADTINDISFSEKSHLVATASFDKRVQIFNYGTMAPVANLKAHSAAVMKVEFLSATMLCSVDKKASVIIWNLSTKKVHRRLKGIHDDVVQISSNDKFLFLGTALGFVIVYDLKSFEQVSRKFINMKSRITVLEYDEEQELLVVASEDGELSYYDIYKGIDKFKKYIQNAQYDKAYSLIKDNSLLEFTDSYNKVQTIWDEKYNKAISLLQYSKKEEALKVFGSFFEILHKKTKIKKLFSEFEDFDKFLLLVKGSNLGLAYSLANQHPIYKESEVYKALEQKWRKLFAKAQYMLLTDLRGKEKIKEILSPYRGVSDKTKHIQEMIVKSDVQARFKDSVLKKDFKMAFALVNVNPFLKEFPDYFSIITFADNLYIKANELIKTQDIHKALKVLKVLIDFPDFKDEARSMIDDIELRDRFFHAIEMSNFIDIYKILDNSMVLQNTQEGKKYDSLWEDDFNLAKVYAINADINGIDGLIKKYKDIPSKHMSIVSIYSLAYLTQIEKAIKTNKEKTIVEKAFKRYILNFGTDDHIISIYEDFTDKYKMAKLDLDTLKKGSKKQWRISMRMLDILE
jgi:WD40 repeat protein